MHRFKLYVLRRSSDNLFLGIGHGRVEWTLELPQHTRLWKDRMEIEKAKRLVEFAHPALRGDLHILEIICELQD